MKENYKYDVALSFAGEDRIYVEQVAVRLKALGISVFYDNFETATLWGKNLYQYISDIYSKESKYTVAFISRNYTRKLWTLHELREAQSRAFAENVEYIVAAKLDDTEITGFPRTIGYIDISNKSPEEFADLIALKVSDKLKKNGLTIEEKITKTEKAETSKKVKNLPLVLYSARPLITFWISERFYNQIHYLWTAPFFDISDLSNPQSSSPAHIYNELKNAVLSNDLHSSKIAEVKLGLIKGAKMQLEKNIIDSETVDEINYMVNTSTVNDFRPIVYVIPTKGIEHLIKEAKISERANPFSKEYIIENLHRSNFDIINIDNQNIRI